MCLLSIWPVLYSHSYGMYIVYISHWNTKCGNCSRLLNKLKEKNGKRAYIKQFLSQQWAQYTKLLSKCVSKYIYLQPKHGRKSSPSPILGNFIIDSTQGLWHMPHFVLNCPSPRKATPFLLQRLHFAFSFSDLIYEFPIFLFSWWNKFEWVEKALPSPPSLYQSLTTLSTNPVNMTAQSLGKLDLLNESEFKWNLCPIRIFISISPGLFGVNG